MEEYKKIATLISVPSFFTLLLCCSSIILTYSYIFNSDIGIITGLLILALSFFAMVKYSCRSNEGTPSDGSKSGKYQNKKTLVLSFIKLLPIPLLVSCFVLIRIQSIVDSSPINDKAKSYRGTVENIRSLRYSKEVIVRFAETVQNKSSNRAISYSLKNINLRHGDEIEIFAKPWVIKPMGDNSFFYTSLLRRGFHYAFYLKNDNFKITRKADIGIREMLRSSLENKISRLFNDDTAPILKALYFGNKNYIDKTTIHDFKRSGALHILAASGLHVGIIASIILFCFLPFRIYKKLILIITIIILFFYIYITDVPVSLLRAFIMFSIWSIQYILDMEMNIINALFLSALVILLLFPYDLYNLGFQLSFGATFGIIVFFRFYNQALSFLPSYLSKSLSVTLSAQTLVFPIILFHLGEINLTGVLSNIFLIPGMGGALVFSFISNILSFISNLGAEITASITNSLLYFNLFLVKYLSVINGHFKIDKNNYFLLLSYSLLLVPVLPLFKNKKILSLCIFAGFLTAWLTLSNNHTKSDNRIAILNEGKTGLILCKKGDKAAITGSLECIEHANILVCFIGTYNIKNIELYMPFADYNNLKSFSYLIKNSLISKCHISSNAIRNSYFKKFCEIIDNDDIKLEIKEFKNSPGHKTKKVNELFKSPIKNIVDIHRLFSRKKHQNINWDGIDNYSVSYL